MKVYLPTIVVIFIDQFSKLWINKNLQHWESWDIIGSFLRFTHVKNPGIAFGISVGKFKSLPEQKGQYSFGGKEVLLSLPAE